MSNKCIIIGGGIMGMMTALELANRHWEVEILEKGECGQESSRAGSGILSPLYPWNEADEVNRLADVGQQIYPELARELTHHTGVDPEWLPSGMLYLDVNEHPSACAWLDQHGFVYEVGEYALLSECMESLFVPHIAQIRSPRLLRGLKQRLLQKRVSIVERVYPSRINIRPSGTLSVTAKDKRFEADCVVIAAGAWSSYLFSPDHLPLDIHPVRGQVIAFQPRQNNPDRMLMRHSKYLIPRKDGLLLAGSTVEYTGFDTQITKSAKQELLDAALSMLPSLSHAEIIHQWSGLRPGTHRTTPLICPAPGFDGVYLNTGHFRNGLTLAPGSAVYLADILEQKKTAEPCFCL